MTLGDKISTLRKESKYTQEQLADILGVSRQAVSKWESDIAYPETDKLIKMGKLFGCSMDYLLNDECTEKNGTVISASVDSFIENVGAVIKKQCRERKSEKTVFGMPLYHIAKNARGFFAIGNKATGVFAVGLCARGVVSLGLLSIGFLSFGLLSVGLIALGTLAIGVLSVGSIALGIFAVGAICCGLISIGALSVGGFSLGALAIGKYIAIGDNARAMIAIGKTDAVGSIYQIIGQVGSLSVEDISQVKYLLDSNVPEWLSWAKEFIKTFVY